MDSGYDSKRRWTYPPEHTNGLQVCEYFNLGRLFAHGHTYRPMCVCMLTVLYHSADDMARQSHRVAQAPIRALE